MNNLRREFMNILHRELMERPEVMNNLRKVGRLLGLLLSLTVVGFLYATVLTRGGILP
jgi:hypothetical protein